MRVLHLAGGSLLILWAIAVPPRAEAGLLTFTTRAAWRAAAGGGTGDLTENFNGVTSDINYGTVPATVGFLTFSADNGGSSFHLIDTSPFFGSTSIDGTTFGGLRTAGSPSSIIFDTRVTASGPVAAIGFDFRLNVDAGNPALRVTTSRGDFVTLPGSTSPAFFGLVYNAGETFTSLLFTPLGSGNNAYYASDNWEAFRTTGAVPEPSSLGLLAVGAAGLAARLLRRRRQAGGKC